MNKKILLIPYILLLLFLSSCSCQEENINLRSYDVGEIDITDFENLVVTAAEKVEKSILGVDSYCLISDGRGGNIEARSIGSCVVYKSFAVLKDGTMVEANTNINNIDHFIYYVITNRHVIEGGYKHNIYISSTDEVCEATIVGQDNKIDIAVLSFKYNHYIEKVKIGDSNDIKKGSFVMAIGNPEGYYDSLTFGVVSYPSRYISEDTNGDGLKDFESEYIQIDAAINPGNSGGALLSLNGELIGINTMKIVNEKIDNLGFAIPSNTINDLLPFLEQGEVPNRLLLGIKFTSVSDLNTNYYQVPESITYGLYINTVNSNSVGFFMGLRPGDIILSINDVKMKYSYQIYGVLGNVIIGSNFDVIINIYRKGNEMTFTYKV